MVIQPITTAITGGNAYSAQQGANQSANNALTQGSQTAQGYQQPYIGLGNLGTQGLTNDLSYLTSPINMNQATLQQTPGYQFTLNQGLKAVNNQQSALGLGNSGAAQKAAASYATGLASNTYQQQFSNAVTNQQNVFSNLMGLTGIGQTASTTAGNAALGTASQIAGNQIGLGNAGAAYNNAIGSSINGSVNNGLAAAYLGYTGSSNNNV